MACSPPASNNRSSNVLSLLVDDSPFTLQELEQLLSLYNEREGHDHGFFISGDLGKEGSIIWFLVSSCSHRPGAQNEDALTHRAQLAERFLPLTFLNTLETAIFHSEESCYLTNNPGINDIALLRFFEAMAICTGRRGPGPVIDLLYDSAISDGAARASELVRLCYLLGLKSSLLSFLAESDEVMEREEIFRFDELPQPLVASLVRHVNICNQDQKSNEGDTIVSRPQFREWINCSTPLLASTLPTFLHYLLFMGNPFPSTRIVPFRFPDLGKQPSVFFGSNPYSSLHFCFGSLSPSLCSKWYQLYSLDHHGSSFAGILEAILGYDGPTVIVIGAEGGGIFGAFTSSKWKVSGDFYGDGDCFLYSIHPCVNVYRPTGIRTNYMYCNPSSRVVFNDGRAHGIGFGGTTDSPRLFIPDSSSLDEDALCKAVAYDTTYDQGPLIPMGGSHLEDRVQIDRLEIWGVGDEDTISKALQSRDFQKTIMEANVRKAQTVTDKGTFMDDLTSGLIAAKLWDHRNHAIDRDACG